MVNLVEEFDKLKKNGGFLSDPLNEFVSNLVADVEALKAAKVKAPKA